MSRYILHLGQDTEDRFRQASITKVEGSTIKRHRNPTTVLEIFLITLIEDNAAQSYCS